MSKMGWQTLYRKPNTSWKNKENKIYPYLLKDIKIDHRNQVWGIDITYVPMRRGLTRTFCIRIDQTMVLHRMCESCNFFQN